MLVEQGFKSLTLAPVLRPFLTPSISLCWIFKEGRGLKKINIFERLVWHNFGEKWIGEGVGWEQKLEP
jgi:hypothetical protein